MTYFFHVCPNCHIYMRAAGSKAYVCTICLHIQLIPGESMARQQKAPVTVTKLVRTSSHHYKNQWNVSGSAALPYTVSEATDGNWSCSCMAWTRNHPREDCKHIMRVKLRENTPVEVKVEPKMQFVQSTGRVFRDA